MTDEVVVLPFFGDALPMRILTLLAFSFALQTALHADTYYAIQDLPKAQAEAQQKHLPLAWLSSNLADLSDGNLTAGSESDLTQMALKDLQDVSVVIFINANAGEMTKTPDIVHHQFSQYDDGDLANHANYITPKIVFSTPDLSKTLGRVSYTDMKSSRDAAIASALQIIKNNPDDQAALAPPAAPQPPPTSATSPSAPTISASSGVVTSLSSQISDYLIYIIPGVILLIILVGLLAWYARPDDTPPSS